MCAFLSNHFCHPIQSSSTTSLCPRRPLPTLHHSCIRASAVTDEVRPVDNPQPANDFTPPVPTPRAEPDSASLDDGTHQPPARSNRNRKDDRRDRSTAPPPFVPDPSATYYTKCGNCQAAYELDPLEVGRGKKVACSVCGNEWFQKPERLTVLKDTEGFKNYPMEEKDQLMAESAKGKRQRQQSSRRGYRDRRPYRSRPRFSVFVGNLPFSVTETELEELINSAVETNRVAIVKDMSGRSKGFAFVDVSSEQEVQTAVDQFNGVQLGGRTIVVSAGRRNT